MAVVSRGNTHGSVGLKPLPAVLRTRHGPARKVHADTTCDRPGPLHLQLTMRDTALGGALATIRSAAEDREQEGFPV